MQFKILPFFSSEGWSGGRGVSLASLYYFSTLLLQFLFFTYQVPLAPPGLLLRGGGEMKYLVRTFVSKLSVYQTAKHWLFLKWGTFVSTTNMLFLPLQLGSSECSSLVWGRLCVCCHLAPAASFLLSRGVPSQR